MKTYTALQVCRGSSSGSVDALTPIVLRSNFELGAKFMEEGKQFEAITCICNGVDNFSKCGALPHCETHIAQEALRSCFAASGNVHLAPIAGSLKDRSSGQRLSGLQAYSVTSVLLPFSALPVLEKIGTSDVEDGHYVYAINECRQRYYITRLRTVTSYNKAVYSVSNKESVPRLTSHRGSPHKQIGTSPTPVHLHANRLLGAANSEDRSCYA
ncbi:hypothetical protein EVAR_69616_1 [Eumeta japonica]|uniref:Uncharacterized protein n=1 Tax=Eumeta variegata TaxID=151549 RepID=A0A4C2AAJ6_EUMVA|nr:hypothetical protein EVAR_69616_1 [Eumeta japonica]